MIARFARRGSPRLGAYAGLAAFALLAALVLGLPELVAVAAPFALLLAVGLAVARPPRVEVSARLARDRVVEDDEAALAVTLRAGSPAAVELLVALPDGLEAAENPRVLRLRRDEERVVDVPVRCARWGAYAVGELHLRASDALGVFSFEAVIDDPAPLRVYPHPERIVSLLAPLETQVFAGNQVARAKGEGIEFADLRPFVPGDRVRRVNWRASARHGELVVNELHPERNTDVVLFLDTFSDVRGQERGTLDLAVRAAAALADEYLERKDRVGVVGFGGILNWLEPSSGLTQLYRVVDSLLDTEVVLNYAWKDIALIPPRTLPPKALVVAITPLLDERSTRALLDLRARGFDLALVEVSPEPFAAPGREASEDLAHRLWVATRAALRHRFEAAGVPVAVWRDGTPLAVALEEVAAYRRFAKPARA